MATRRHFGLEITCRAGKYSSLIAEKFPGLQSLSPDEKLTLVGELWEELAARPDALPTREEHVRLLRKRLEHYRRHPEDTVAWEDLKARILAPLF